MTTLGDALIAALTDALAYERGELQLTTVMYHEGERTVYVPCVECGDYTVNGECDCLYECNVVDFTERADPVLVEYVEVAEMEWGEEPGDLMYS